MKRKKTRPKAKTRPKVRQRSILSQHGTTKKLVVVEQPETARPGRHFKSIYEHSDQELTEAIEFAVSRHPDFYVLLHGIDAYMERRRRQRERRKALRDQLEQSLLNKYLHDPWGN